MNTPTPEVVKWYTRARKFPQLIGRTPDGAKIWGGPYTFTQAIGGGLVLLVGVNTMGLWANYGLIGNAILLLGVTYGIVMLLGRIPVGSRSPLSVITGTLQAVFSPHTGRLAGRPVRLRRPHRVRHRITVLLDQPAPPLPGRLPRVPPTGRSAAAAPKPAPAAEPEPTPAPRRPVALSGVQSLLAQARTRPPVQED